MYIGDRTRKLLENLKMPVFLSRDGLRACFSDSMLSSGHSFVFFKGNLEERWRSIKFPEYK